MKNAIGFILNMLCAVICAIGMAGCTCEAVNYLFKKD